MVSTTIFLTACGGSGESTSTVSSQYNLSGTVPGTLIEAFCDNGSYYKVNSEHNGTDKHPFVLKLPTNVSCRVLMTTNEHDSKNNVVTPIKVSTKQGAGIAFKSDDDLDLGHVDLALSRASMKADSNKDGVEDEPTEVQLEGESLEIMEADDPLDDDNDGIINVYEDDDGDGINNHDDDDDDNDGVLDVDDSDNDDDHDGDGIDDTEDEDDDNDGIDDDNDKDDDNDGIEDQKSEKEKEDSTNSDTVITTPSAGRLLASQCAQCHRTDANPDKGFEDLIGEEIYGDLVEMIRENKPELMHLQANGYNEEQIRLMDEYFNNLSETKGDE